MDLSPPAGCSSVKLQLGARHLRVGRRTDLCASILLGADQPRPRQTVRVADRSRFGFSKSVFVNWPWIRSSRNAPLTGVMDLSIAAIGSTEHHRHPVVHFLLSG